MASVILHFAFLIGIPFSTGASCVWSELLTRTTSTQGGVHGSVPRSQPTPRREYAGSRSGTLDFWIGLVRATVHGPSDMALPSTAGERHSRTSQEGFRRRSKRRRWRCPQGWLEPLLGGQASRWSGRPLPTASRCAKMVLSDLFGPSEGGGIHMEEVSVIGIDLAKPIWQSGAFRCTGPGRTGLWPSAGS